MSDRRKKRLRQLALSDLLGGVSDTTSTLLANLVAYWKMDEESDGSSPVARFDSVGVNHLSDNSTTVASAAGKIGNCGVFVAADSTYLSVADNADLSVGNSDYEIVFWVKVNADATMRLISKDNGSTVREYGLQYNTTSKRFLWFAFFSTVVKIATANTFGQPSADGSTWYMLDVYFDKTNQTIGISVNNGAFDTTATASATLDDLNEPFELGRCNTGASGSELATANIDEIGVWKRLLTAAERTSLYNGGSGSTYPFDGSNPVGTFLPPVLARYASNPVIALGSAGSWEDVDVANPDVFWDTPNNRWVMNYSGWDGSLWRTGLAYSTDLLTWTKEPTNPVFEPEGGETYIAANGSIVLKNSTYYLYYQANEAARIYLATSPDLLNWTRQNGGNPVIDVGSVGTWDSMYIADPMARVLEDGTIEVYYLGGMTAKAIGKATSSDGVSFIKVAGPWLSDYCAFSTGEPSIYGTSPLKMFFDGADVSGTRRINWGISYDSGTTWLVSKFRFGTGAADAWDDTQVLDSFPVVSNGILYLFYAGAPTTGASEGMGLQIGMARWTIP